MFERSIIDIAAACLIGGLLCSAGAVQAAPDFDYKVTHRFTGKAKGREASELTSGGDGWFYGTARTGGAHNAGTLFRVDSRGTLEVLHDFTGGAGGSSPAGGVTRIFGGTLYGTTSGGGSGFAGTLYRYRNGVHTVLHSFSRVGAAGSVPQSPPVQGPDGAFYGTTAEGGSPTSGSCDIPWGCGQIYRIDADGTLTQVYGFNQADVGGPGSRGPIERLVMGDDAKLYGVSPVGGSEQGGAIYRYSAAGGYSIVHHFKGPDGSVPGAGLTRGTDGYLYGTTWYGGTDDSGTVYRLNVSSGELQTVYSFAAGGLRQPHGAVVQGADGTLYGTAAYGGNPACTGGCGGVYAIQGGVLHTLHAFEGTQEDGRRPETGLALNKRGSLYGTTAGDKGTVYRLRQR